MKKKDPNASLKITKKGDALTYISPFKDKLSDYHTAGLDTFLIKNTLTVMNTLSTLRILIAGSAFKLDPWCTGKKAGKIIGSWRSFQVKCLSSS